MRNKSKRVAEVGSECVACGTCVKACPLGAITIYKGLTALVNVDKCVGCGKCSIACPASVISIEARKASGGEGAQ